jgi:ubiquinone/menaquinone biosynthesis C-methylase UbiE
MEQKRLADYYNYNTKRFLRWSTGKGELAMHRPIWAARVKTRRQANYYANALVLQSGEAVEAGSILDLGCGIGGTLLYLSESMDARYSGLTISSEQVHVGSQIVQKHNKQQQIRLFLGDFNDPNSFRLFPNQDLIFAIESLIHTPDLKQVIGTISTHLRQGGRFVVIDHFLSDERVSTPALTDLQQNWYAPRLATRDSIVSLCAHEGLVLLEEDELTPFIKMNPFMLLFGKILSGIFKGLKNPNPAQERVIGETALNTLRRKSMLHYHHLVFVKAE